MNLKEAHSYIDVSTKAIIGICPHCQTKVHLELLWKYYHYTNDLNITFYVIFKCDPCKRIVPKIFVFEQNPESTGQDLSPKGWLEKLPESIGDEFNKVEKPPVPKQVLSDYQEALNCVGISANRASFSMFRRALQGALTKIGANHELDLVEQIKSLEALPPDIKYMAHQLRILGNWDSDTDRLKEVGHKDVSEARDFTSKLLSHAFIMPENVTAPQIKRWGKLESKPKEATEN